MKMIKELEDIQKREINWQISCFYDAGFTVKIGDEMNGFKWEGQYPSLNEAISCLIDKINELYPNTIKEGILSEKELKMVGTMRMLDKESSPSCSVCKGKGKIEVRDYYGVNFPQECSECNGTGK